MSPGNLLEIIPADLLDILYTQVDSLTLNDDLTSMAQQWAEHLASINELKHCNAKYQGQPVGENVAAKRGTGPVDYTGQSVV